MEEKTVWGIHAGRTGDAHNLYNKKKLVALGWPHVGDLSVLEQTRDAYKAKLSSSYPMMKPGAVPVNAGQLFRFIHEMKVGDIIVYPSKIDKQIHIGRVKGEYFFVKGEDTPYPNSRHVDWLKSVPRKTFSQGALYEVGSALSFFQIKNYADEFIAVIEGKAIPIPEDDDATIAYVADEIKQFTSDFVIRTLFRELKGHPFTDFVAHLLSNMGYKTRVSPEGPDGGVDIVAHRDELGFEPPIIKVQVKSTEGNVGDPVVSSLYGKVDSNEFGMIVTLGGFTRQAVAFANNKSNLRLVDGEQLMKLIFNYYEELDSRYKSILPLKQVYVPEVIPEQGG